MDYSFYENNQHFRRRTQEEGARTREELRRNREEATKKYEEEMAGYSISSHDIPPANENKPLVFSIPDLSSPDRCILDVSTKVFHSISSPHLRDALCLYNKGEWLLMCHEEEICSKQYQNSLFLLNPRSGSRIDLPGPFEKGHFAFNLTNSGNPRHIIHASYKIPTKSVVIRIIHPYDSAWEVHELGNSHNQHIIISYTLVIGNQIMCIDSKGANIVMLDLANCSWTFLSKRKKFPNYSECYFFEQDNEVMCVSCPSMSCDFFKFYKLDWQMMDWLEINNVELMNTSWFLSHPCSFYLKGGKGKYVYSFESIGWWGGQPGERTHPTYRQIGYFRRESEDDLPVNVFIHNMVDCDMEILLPEKYGSKKPACWVDRRILY
ncbi:hypothetical protein MA16_Dca002407 [Dendrobium catenatum]|uniref:KIB1-4 beta-propeller domain-containing protein n=1 Tax=Dendrobium catenatum TaxID=906689 RepID=A0A2I0W0G2_9ASPA|nr:hypothetical protein MA16_Dca002407 [Dendrobium catenatum]